MDVEEGWQASAAGALSRTRGSWGDSDVTEEGGSVCTFGIFYSQRVSFFC